MVKYIFGPLTTNAKIDLLDRFLNDQSNMHQCNILK